MHKSVIYHFSRSLTLSCSCVPQPVPQQQVNLCLQISNSSCSELALGCLIADRLWHPSKIQSTLFHQKNPPQIVIRVHSLSSIHLDPQESGSLVLLLCPGRFLASAISLCLSREPGIRLAPRSLRYIWQTRFSL